MPEARNKESFKEEKKKLREKTQGEVEMANQNRKSDPFGV